jgi:hypothetical protein
MLSWCNRHKITEILLKVALSTINQAYLGVMGSMLTSCELDREFEFVQTKDYSFGIWSFSDKHTALRSKQKLTGLKLGSG